MASAPSLQWVGGDIQAALQVLRRDEWQGSGTLASMDKVDDKEWTVVTKGYRPKLNESSKIVTTNNYSILTPADDPTIMDTTPPPTITPTTHSPKNSSKKMNKHQRRAFICQHRCAVLQKLNKSEKLFLDTYITQRITPIISTIISKGLGVGAKPF